MSKGVSLSRVRRELNKQEIKLAENSARDFKIFVRSLPFRARLILAYKILRGIL